MAILLFFSGRVLATFAFKAIAEKPQAKVLVSLHRCKLDLLQSMGYYLSIIVQKLLEVRE